MILSQRSQSILKTNRDLTLIDNLSSKNCFLALYLIYEKNKITNLTYFSIFQGIPHNIG